MAIDVEWMLGYYTLWQYFKFAITWKGFAGPTWSTQRDYNCFEFWRWPNTWWSLAWSFYIFLILIQLVVALIRQNGCLLDPNCDWTEEVSLGSLVLPPGSRWLVWFRTPEDLCFGAYVDSQTVGTLVGELRSGKPYQEIWRLLGLVGIHCAWLSMIGQHWSSCKYPGHMLKPLKMHGATCFHYPCARTCFRETSPAAWSWLGLRCSKKNAPLIMLNHQYLPMITISCITLSRVGSPPFPTPIRILTKTHRSSARIRDASLSQWRTSNASATQVREIQLSNSFSPRFAVWGCLKWGKHLKTTGWIELQMRKFAECVQVMLPMASTLVHLISHYCCQAIKLL